MLEHTLTQEERSQIAQTIEMFEVITQTQADDYQSLEILKDAYAKIGRAEDSHKTSRRLAEAYFNVGSYTLAMQECETVLQADPNSPEILAMLGDIETRLQGTSHLSPAAKSAEGRLTAKHLNGEATAAHEGALVDLHARSSPAHDGDRGDDQLAKFLIMQQLFTEEEVGTAVETVKMVNKSLSGQGLATSLIDQLCAGNAEKSDGVLSALIDRTKFAFVPLEYYDVDRQVARMLPEKLTLGRLFVPFDLISRTIMVACVNPFDANGREAVQQSLDYTVEWYLARPAAVSKALQDVYRLESRA